MLMAGALRGLHAMLKAAPEVLALADDDRSPLAVYRSAEVYYYVLRAIHYGRSRPGRRIPTDLAEIGHMMMARHAPLFARYIVVDSHALFDALLLSMHLQARHRIRAVAPYSLAAVLQVVAAHLASPTSAAAAAATAPVAAPAPPRPAAATAPPKSALAFLKAGRGKRTGGGAGGGEAGDVAAGAAPVTAAAIDVKADFRWFIERFARMMAGTMAFEAVMRVEQRNRAIQRAGGTLIPLAGGAGFEVQFAGSGGAGGAADWVNPASAVPAGIAYSVWADLLLALKVRDCRHTIASLSAMCRPVPHIAGIWPVCEAPRQHDNPDRSAQHGCSTAGTSHGATGPLQCRCW